VEGDVDGSEGSNVGRGRTGGGETRKVIASLTNALNLLLSERAGQCRPEREGLADGVDVEDGGTR
jgi:hypothetical protein